MARYWVIVLLLITVGQSLAAPFRNLGFDEGITNNVQYLPRDPFLRDAGLGAAAELVPGWQLYRGLNTPVTEVGYNLRGPRPGAPDNFFSIVSQDFVPDQIEGKFYLYVFNPTFGLQFSQQGDIPSDAIFLSFRNFIGAFGVTINGETFTPSFDGTPEELFNISRYAGQNVQMTFTAAGDVAAIDSIAFVVPEPASYVLFGVAGLAFLLRTILRKIARS